MGPPPQSHQLPQEGVRSHLQHQAKEEAEVNRLDPPNQVSSVSIAYYYLLSRFKIHSSFEQEPCAPSTRARGDRQKTKYFVHQPPNAVVLNKTKYTAIF